MSSLVAERRAFPDAARVAACLRAPQRGPRLLFFSGGSALRGVSRVLKRHTHNSVHLVTPFDSGGSSAVLRRAFGVMSVGDLRSRLLALADEDTPGNPAVYRLFSHRFASDDDNGRLRQRLRALAEGDDELMCEVPEPLRAFAREHLRSFGEAAPPTFDYRGASVGNLVLTGAWLDAGRDMEAALRRFTALAQVRGTVRPTVTDALHLRAELDDGTVLCGQHRITGKEGPPIGSPLRELSLIASLEAPAPARASAAAQVVGDVAAADLLVFPMGSFYTSVLANLLPAGVGRAVAASRSPKLYVPNVGLDPEMLGMRLSDAVAALLRHVRADAEGASADRVLSGVLLDPRHASYGLELDLDRVEALGVPVLQTPLLDDDARRHDPRRVVEALLSFP